VGGRSARSARACSSGEIVVAPLFNAPHQQGSPSEDGQALPEGEGNGIIWRLLAITRFLERDGGVYVELEAMGLTRCIPPSFRWFVEPIVRRVSRDSLLTSLEQTGKAVQHRAELANRKTGSGGSMTGTADQDSH
jgi:hypothetical protein